MDSFFYLFFGDNNTSPIGFLADNNVVNHGIQNCPTEGDGFQLDLDLVQVLLEEALGLFIAPEKLHILQCLQVLLHELVAFKASPGLKFSGGYLLISNLGYYLTWLDNL